MKLAHELLSDYARAARRRATLRAQICHVGIVTTQPSRRLLFYPDPRWRAGGGKCGAVVHQHVHQLGLSGQRADPLLSIRVRSVQLQVPQQILPIGRAGTRL
jgi:hypothetical protein